MLSSEIKWKHSPERYSFLAGEFDVNAARRLIEDSPREVVEADISKAPVSMHRLDPATTPIDLDIPIICITLKADGTQGPWPIDGWHRIEKAQKEGRKTLPAVILTLNETRRITPAYLYAQRRRAERRVS